MVATSNRRLSGWQRRADLPIRLQPLCYILFGEICQVSANMKKAEKKIHITMITYNVFFRPHRSAIVPPIIQALVTVQAVTTRMVCI